MWICQKWSFLRSKDNYERWALPKDLNSCYRWHLQVSHWSSWHTNGCNSGLWRCVQYSPFNATNKMSSVAFSSFSSQSMKAWTSPQMIRALIPTQFPTMLSERSGSGYLNLALSSHANAWALAVVISNAIHLVSSSHCPAPCPSIPSSSTHSH